MIGGIGMQEMLLIFLVILLLFGAKRIPEIAHGLGKGISEFKRAMQETQDELKREINAPLPAPKKDDTAAPPPAPQP
jgi:sec-independent protein translocase protein TatA